MDWLAMKPTSFRANNAFGDWAAEPPALSMLATKPHDAHPSIDHLVLLVFEAVLEVVCVSAPGYIIARLGYFDAEKQKFLANLNVMLFTPCLIFTKLASQLNADKLVDLAVIPIIFVIQTLVSYVVSVGVARAFRFKKRPANFLTAMGVFGNSNSLPISLVISLSQTLKGLHWDRIKGDNDDEVAARGILYLLIFQQLGQLVRWSWGYHVLLAPKNRYEEYQDETVEEGRYRDVSPHDEALIPGLDGHAIDDDVSDASDELDAYEPAGRTPVVGTSLASPGDSDDESTGPRRRSSRKYGSGVNSTDGLSITSGPGSIVQFPRVHDSSDPEIPEGIKGFHVRAKLSIQRAAASTQQRIVQGATRAFQGLPQPVQNGLTFIWRGLVRVYSFLWDFMNPPLWAMLMAIVVASVPDLQRLFFQEGTFINNSVTRAVSQSGGVAVPLILVVLGANLARNTQKQEGSRDPEEEEIGTKLLVASIISRMLLPTLIIAPILALFAKYVPVSILDDPIFIVVCFLLTGAPSALQLAQICQINEVFEGVMSKILFQSYVIWILPSTLVLVLLALETVEWAR
ncbi:auxin efflux carrier [Hypoxylon sp. NC1633]|nr:auxin efflux carrier [Hypoxylon sp. NC1633]